MPGQRRQNPGTVGGGSARSPGQVRGCIGCVAVILLLRGGALADVVSVGGANYSDVRVVNIHGGKVSFRLPDGRTKAKPIGQITRIELSEPAEYGSAVRLMAAGSYRNAIAAFKRAARQTNVGWLQSWIDLQLLRCHDRLGQFGEATRLFVRVARAFPGQASSLLPAEVPSRGSTMNAEALAILGSARKSLSDPAARAALDELYMLVLKAEDPSAYAKLAQSRPAGRRVAAAGRVRQKMNQAARLLKRRAYAEALVVLGKLVPIVASDQVWQVYLMRGRALMGTEDYLHAALDFVKVGVCQGDARLRIEGYEGAAQACEKLSLAVEAGTLRDRARRIKRELGELGTASRTGRREGVDATGAKSEETQ